MLPFDKTKMEESVFQNKASLQNFFKMLSLNLVIFLAVLDDFGEFCIIEIAIVICLCTEEHLVTFFFCKPES